jgi:hypothetical protein
MPRSDRESRSLIEGFRLRADLSPSELWWRYFALGGNATPTALDGFLAGRVPPARADHDLLAQALNERFAHLGQDSPVPYFDQLGPAPSRERA